MVALAVFAMLLQLAQADAAPPASVLFDPTSGPVGTEVTLTGVGFQDDSVVTDVMFNGTPATFIVDSDNQIRTTVPDGASTGPISVTDSEGTFTTLMDFTVSEAEPPVIAGFSPTSGPVGSGVTITGTGFTDASSVRFNGTSAPFTVGSDSQIAATVPNGATSGPISVTTPGGTDTSTTSFTVTDPSQTHDRRVQLRLKRGPTALGRVVALDGYAPCVSGATVRIQLLRSDWDTVETTESNGQGRFRAELTSGRGWYRAVVARSSVQGGEHACAQATSARRKYQHGH